MNRSDCEAIAPLLMPWKSGELSMWQSFWVGRHVRHCPHCAQELAELQKLDQMLAVATPFGQEATTPPIPSLGGLRFFPVVAGILVLLGVVGRMNLIGAGGEQHSALSSSRPLPKTEVIAQAHEKPSIPPSAPEKVSPSQIVPKYANRLPPKRTARVARRIQRKPRLLAQVRHIRRQHRPLNLPVSAQREAKEVFVLVAIAPPQESIYIEAHKVSERESL